MLRRLFDSPLKPRNSVRRSGARRLRLESLEVRQLFAADSMAGDPWLNEGTLTIEGGEGDDVAIVARVGDRVVVRLNDRLSHFDASEVRKLSFHGQAGNDRFRNKTDLDSQAFGGDGNDRFVGGAGNDHLSGGDGDDLLCGGGGDDHLMGERGFDRLRGDSGDDRLEGGDDDDRLAGGIGNDELFGDNGNDLLWADSLRQSAWRIPSPRTDDGLVPLQLLVNNDYDRLYGGDGDDRLRGDAAGHLAGGAGDDRLRGGRKANDLFGDEGNDSLVGGQENDTIHGGDGNDRLKGNDGDDRMLGEAGNDVCRADGRDILVDGGDGIDRIVGPSSNSNYVAFEQSIHIEDPELVYYGADEAPTDFFAGR